MANTVEKQMFPCSLELDITKDMAATYPAGFFELFGTGEGLGLEEEPEELPFDGGDGKVFLP